MPYFPPASSGSITNQPGSRAWFDDFSTDRTAADYDLAGGGNIVVSGGHILTSVINAEGQIVVKGSKFCGVGDQCAQAKIIPSTTVTGSILNLIYNVASNNVLLIWNLQTNVWTSFKNIAGSVTTSTFVEVGSYTPTAGTSFWVRWMRKSGMAVALIYTTDPLVDTNAVPVKGVYQTVAGPADTVALAPGMSLQAAATANLWADDLHAWN